MLNEQLTRPRRVEPVDGMLVSASGGMFMRRNSNNHDFTIYVLTNSATACLILAVVLLS